MTTRQRIVTAMLCVLPVVWLLLLLQRYYVPCFHSDEWTDTLPMMAHYLEGTLTFSQLNALVGDHRLLFPHLITLGLGILTHWDVRYELAAELVLAGLVTMNIGLIIRQSGGDWRLMPVVCLLIFSPAGYENWMLGYQICFWLVLVCLTAIPWVAGTKWKYVGTALLCVVASFSCASGLVSWAMAFTLLWPTARHNLGAGRLKLLLLMGFGLISTLLYFQGWSHRTPNQGPKHLPLLLFHPVDSMLYFLSYFGNPFARGFLIDENTMGCITGTILLGLFVAGTVLARRRKLLPECLPWVALGIGIILISAETTYGRLGGLQSRYIPYAALFSISLMFLLQHLKLAPILPVVLVPLAILSAISCNPYWEYSRYIFGLSQVKQQLVDVVDETNSLKSVTIVALKHPAETIGQIRTLEQHGWRTPHLSFDALPARGYAQLGKRAYGKGIQGQAMLGDRPANAVILTREGIPFAVATPATDGFWDAVLPPGQPDLTPQAWAYSAETQTAFPLPYRAETLNETIPATK